jgi:hypothetical protein
VQIGSHPVAPGKKGSGPASADGAGTDTGDISNFVWIDACEFSAHQESL